MDINFQKPEAPPPRLVGLFFKNHVLKKIEVQKCPQNTKEKIGLVFYVLCSLGSGQVWNIRNE
jgi:hypothetical protein